MTLLPDDERHGTTRGALCIGQHALFDSTNPADHHEAKQLCAACPLLPKCDEDTHRLHATTPLEGTWAGQLYHGDLARRRLCGFCDAEFTPTRTRWAHCSDECSDSARRAIQRRHQEQRASRMGERNRAAVA